MESLTIYIITAFVALGILMILSEEGIGFEGCKYEDLTEKAKESRIGMILFCCLIWPIILIVWLAYIIASKVRDYVKTDRKR